MLILPREEYDWFDIQCRSSRDSDGSQSIEPGLQSVERPEPGAVLISAGEPSEEASTQRQFFDYAGPLHNVLILPTASTVAVRQSRRFRALPRDRSRRRVEEHLTFAWEIVEGAAHYPLRRIRKSALSARFTRPRAFVGNLRLSTRADCRVMPSNAPQGDCGVRDSTPPAT